MGIGPGHLPWDSEEVPPVPSVILQPMGPLGIKTQRKKAKCVSRHLQLLIGSEVPCKYVYSYGLSCLSLYYFL